TTSPSSSAVRSRIVCRRQLRISSRSRNTPRTMLVLPTSIASSMEIPAYFTGDEPLERVAAADQQRATVVDAGRDAAPRTVGAVPLDARAVAAECAQPPRV